MSDERACLMFHNSKLRVKKMTIYNNDVCLSYTAPKGQAEKTYKRGAVDELSAKSIKKLAFYAQNTSIEMVTFITLTYPAEYPSNGKEVKKHLNRFLSWVRALHKGVEYLWFMEFQRRGAPHFHVILDADMTGEKREISQRWYDAVGSEDKKHLQAGTNTQRVRERNGAARYVAKYASKQYQKKRPEGYRDCGRFWGCSRGVKPVASQEYNVSGMTGQDMVAFFEGVGWPYAQNLDKPLTVLYNAAQYLSNTLDK